MKFHNMRKIFINDWRRILHNPVAIIITIGICVLPALYAWVNIKACWDVYENTGSIPVAIVNNDQTVEFKGKEVNIGKGVVDQLKNNKKIDWKFVSQRQADLGLADGTYFAAIELPADFSESFTTLLSDTPVKPKIIYKVDTKVNPVAEKITESAKNTLVQEIKSNFVSTVNQSIFSMLNPVGEDADENLQSVIQMKDAIVNLNQNMDVISYSLDNLHTNSINLNQFLSSVNTAWPLVENGLETAGKTAASQQTLSRDAQKRLNNSLTYMDTNLSYVQNSSQRVHALLTELNSAAKEGSTAKMDTVFSDLDATMSAMSGSVDATASYLKKYREIDWGEDAENAEEKLTSLRASLVNLRSQLVQLRKNLKELSADSEAFYNYLDKTIPELEKQVQDIDESLDTLIPALEAFNESLHSTVLQASIDALKSLRDSGIGDKLITDLKEIQATHKDTTAAIASVDQAAANGIQMIDDAIPKIDKTVEFLKTVQNNQSDKKAQLTKMIRSLDSIGVEIDSMRGKLSDIHKQSDAAAQLAAGKADTINDDLYQMESQLTNILKEYNQSIRGNVSTIGQRLVTSADNAAQLSQSAQKLGSEIGTMLKTAQSGTKLTSDLTGSLSSKLKEFKGTIQTLGGKLELVDNNDVVQIISILQSNPEFMGDFIAEPFEQKVEYINAVPNYGSSMAPIYTALALWVGCLILNSILRSRPLEFEGSEQLTLREKHYGKMMTFCSMALIQGIVISLGDILLLKIYVVNSMLFIFFAVFSSIVFCIITYTLYSTLGNAGKALAIVYMIFQIPGSGGTYPIQVDPPIFSILQPLFPFAYTVSGFREAIAGPLTSQVLLDFAVLGLFALIFLIAGYFIVQRMAEPVHRFEEMFESSGLGE